MKNEKKINLTADELKDCETFEQIRLSYNMTQKQWAKALDISYGLVKRIETHTIKCSLKTKAKVRNFTDRYLTDQNTPDLHGLEAHILYDIFLSHMEQIPKKEASICSARCTKLFQDILSTAAECGSEKTQHIFFQYLEQLLTTLALATADAVAEINEGIDILNINNGIKNVFANKQVTRFKHSKNVIVSKNGEVIHQYDISDFL